MIVPAPITSVVWTRLTKTSISLVHAGRSAQSSGTSDSQGSSVRRVSWMSSRICHALPLNVSRLRAFQYSGSPDTTRMTSLPSRGQLIGP